MYGLINKAIRDMIIERYSQTTWEAIYSKAGVPEASFLTMRSNDDSVTFDLVVAAAEDLGISVEVCLRLFGQYWIEETSVRTYETMMNSTGNTLPEFLSNLNTLHDRINTTFLNYSPPSFRLESSSNNCYELHYSSKREGLQPFVEGLLIGLANRFSTSLDITGVEERASESGAHLVFNLVIGKDN